MKRNLLSVILLTTLALGVSLNAEPTPIPDRTSKNTKKIETPKPPAALPLAAGWNYVKGEWIHSDGYKYVKGQVIPSGVPNKKKPPKPPSKALLDSVRTRPPPSPDPNSAAAKAAEKERNLRTRPAAQTGSHL
jgi:hypothetical protein